MIPIVQPIQKRTSSRSLSEIITNQSMAKRGVRIVEGIEGQFNVIIWKIRFQNMGNTVQ